MSSNGETPDGAAPSGEHSGQHYQVKDEDGYADNERKKHVMQLRREVDAWKGELRKSMVFDELTEEEAVTLWHGKVRTFLVAIEPLLRDEDLQNSTEYYEQVEIGTVTIHPPREYRQQSMVPTAEKLRQRNNEVLLSDPPQPKSETLYGLRSVIERETVSAEWTVPVRAENGPAIQERSVHQERLLPWSILQNALRRADQFLQDVNVGFEVMKEDKRDAEFTYDDILENGPPEEQLPDFDNAGSDEDE
jgi:hypothetical protein